MPGSVRHSGPEHSFARRVLSVVRRIPVGRVATYGDVAQLAGRPGAARAVGNVMGGCRDASVPCHRVVAAGGRLGGYGGFEGLKRQLLEAEGCQVQGGRVREFRLRRWPATDRKRGREYFSLPATSPPPDWGRRK